MAILNFNYNRAINQARQIETIASDMKNTADKDMQTAIDSIGACWQGEASRQFIGYCSGVQADIIKQANDLKNIAVSLRSAAKIIKEAEDKAKKLQP